MNWYGVFKQWMDICDILKTLWGSLCITIFIFLLMEIIVASILCWNNLRVLCDLYPRHNHKHKLTKLSIFSRCELFFAVFICSCALVRWYVTDIDDKTCIDVQKAQGCFMMYFPFFFWTLFALKCRNISFPSILINHKES